jgi:AbiV family abortive infection protein
MDKNINLKKLERMAGLAFKNGLRLHRDSRLLFKNKAYPSAFLLSVLAIEELSKALLIEHQWWHSLCDGRMKPNEEEECLKIIYYHEVKQSNFVYFFDTLGTKSKFLKKFLDGSIESAKQNATYVGLKKFGRKIVLGSKINNPFKTTSKKAKKIITLLNDKLLELCLMHIKKTGGLDAETITKQFNRQLYNKLKKEWPTISRSAKLKLKKIEAVK